MDANTVKLGLKILLDVAPIVAAAIPGGEVAVAGLKVLATLTKVYEEQVETQQLDETLDSINREISNLQSSISDLQEQSGVLESTTATLSLGMALQGVLSGKNLLATGKVENKINIISVTLEKGLITLKEAIYNQGDEILKTINQVSQEIKQEIHRVEFIKAYGIFKSVHDSQLPSALITQNPQDRNDKLNLIWSQLQTCLAIYNNNELISCPTIAGKFKRLECAWSIEQTLALVDILKNDFEACVYQLNHLKDKIIKDCFTLTESCQSEEEIDYIFPRINYILNQDMLLIDFWKNNLKVIPNLSMEDRKIIASLDVRDIVLYNQSQDSQAIQQQSPVEQYQELKAKSHYLSLKDQLKFLIKPEFRSDYESYITQRAIAINLKGFVPSNWQEVPDLTVANLYYYLKDQE